MGDVYRVDELRFPQEYNKASAAAGIFVDCTDFVVPANVVRTLFYASYGCDATEARYVMLKVIAASGVTHCIRGPVAFDNNNGQPFSFLEQGQEVRLLPGDRLRFDRNAATAGSIMTLFVRFVDHILPFQLHVDPYDRARRRSPFLANPPGIGGVGGGGGGVAGGTEGGGYSPEGRGGEPLV